MPNSLKIIKNPPTLIKEKEPTKEDKFDAKNHKYPAGTIWVIPRVDKVFILTSYKDGKAIWKKIVD